MNRSDLVGIRVLGVKAVSVYVAPWVPAQVWKRLPYLLCGATNLCVASLTPKRKGKSSFIIGFAVRDTNASAALSS